MIETAIKDAYNPETPHEYIIWQTVMMYAKTKILTRVISKCSTSSLLNRLSDLNINENKIIKVKIIIIIMAQTIQNLRQSQYKTPRTSPISNFIC